MLWFKHMIFYFISHEKGLGNAMFVCLFVWVFWRGGGGIALIEYKTKPS